MPLPLQRLKTGQKVQNGQWFISNLPLCAASIQIESFNVKKLFDIQLLLPSMLTLKTLYTNLNVITDYMKTIMSFITRLSLLLLGLCLLPQSQAETIVTTHKVNFTPYTKAVQVTGRLANKAEQRLSFKIQGVVAEIHVDEGQKVTAGQLLATLDQEEITAQVKQAQSVFDNSSRNLQRFERLFADKVITQEQLQTAQTQQDVARSDLQIAKFNQKHAEIRATSDGWILKRLIEKQELVNPNQAAFVISNEGKGWILRVGVTDRDIIRIQQNNQASIKLDAYPNQTLSGKVTEIAAAADNNTGLFEVEIRLSQQHLRLYSGFIAQASIQTQEVQELAFIPVEALVSASGKSAQLFVLDQYQQAQRRQVTLAFIQGDSVAISAGLSEGEEVIDQGAAYLRNGSKVSLAQQ